jgi:hypothetical protein
MYIMRSFIFLTLFSSFCWAGSEYQKTIDQCIGAWGTGSPFKKGTEPQRIITPGVKVFGIGKDNTGDDKVTAEPQLILVRPAVNVLGKSTIALDNPNGWYCFKANVSVLGKISIEAHCKSHIATAGDEGTSVMAANDSDGGVAVLGSLRITKKHCGEASTEKTVEKVPEKSKEETEEKKTE